MSSPAKNNDQTSSPAPAQEPNPEVLRAMQAMQQQIETLKAQLALANGVNPDADRVIKPEEAFEHGTTVPGGRYVRGEFYVNADGKVIGRVAR